MKILKYLIRLDIYDLNIIYSSEKWNYLYSQDTSKPRKGYIIRCAAFVWHLLYNIFNKRQSDYKKIQPKSVLLFSSSKNQYDALSSIKLRLKSCHIIGIRGYGDVEFPLGAAYLASIPFFPIVIFKYFKNFGYRKKTFSLALDYYVLTYGYYLVWLWLLRKLKPSVIVVSNDHLMWTRTIVEVAKIFGVKTIYVQHASVGNKFPALTYDYAFLDGYDALKKYDKPESKNTKVYLTGISKFDKYLKWINKNIKMDALGICSTTTDKEELVENLIREIRREFSELSIYFRPHLADRRKKYWIELSKKYHLIYSSPEKEISFDFLKKVDAIVAGLSNIVLEAVLMNIYPIYYNFNPKLTDCYSFLENKLVNGIEADPKVVSQILEKITKYKPNIRNRAKAYCQTVGTKYDGRSGNLVIELIEKICSGDNIDMRKWVKVNETRHITAYKPIDYK